MELVYLWVEEYKNIKEEGFNFSPRFECEFFPEYEEDANGKKKLKNDCKLVIKPQEHTSIFPKNINVTAIVGENGSGKSMIVITLANALNTIIKGLLDKNYFLIFKKESELYIVTNFKIHTQNKCKQILIQTYSYQTQHADNKEILKILSEINTSLYDFSLSLTAFKNIYKKEICYPNKTWDIEYIEKVDIKNIIYYLFDKKHKTKFGNYFEPHSILLQTNQFEKNHREIDLKKEFKNINDLQNSLTNSIDHFLFIIYEYLSYGVLSLSQNFNFEELRDVVNIDDFSSVISNKIQTVLQEVKKIDFFDKHVNAKDYIKNIQVIFNYSKKIEESKISLENTLIFNKDRIAFSSFGMEFIINIKNLKNNLYIIEELPNCFDINFKDVANIQYSDLSNGEKTALRVRFYLEKVIKDTKKKNFLVLLDEPNNDFHPLWQKIFLSYLINTFKNRDEKFHFIITSHSPFILSDLPKENVIFLEKGKQVDPKIETFGANIHTLLSHGFFMKDGLMGEFAKEKINKAIKYLNQKTLSEDEIDYCENIISIIGEPILKRQLQKMLDSKRLSEVEQIKKQIKELQEELAKKEDKR
jgi:predicted ATP-binding protein involved in virulence